MVASPENVGAKGVPFFMPAQNPPAGTAIPREDGSLPKIFQPLQIRGVKIPNRIWVSPMCQFSCKEGFQCPWNYVHYGALTARGPGFTMVEATAVSENGRITPECGGIWLDAHIEGLRKHVDFAHSQNAIIAIQLGHAGRKASRLAPWLGSTVANEDVGGWPERVVGPDNEPFDIIPEERIDPHALTLAEIEQIKRDFVAGAKRAVRAGFDIIELHYAHGYLMSSFLSPLSNARTDQYGGSFENRVRLPLEVVDAVRAALPETMPLFVRISGYDWLKDTPGYTGGSWDVEQSAQLAQLLADRGVDVLDVSSGGMHRDQKVKTGPGYQVPLAKYIKKAVGDKMLVSAVGAIRSAAEAEKIITGSANPDDPALDLIAVGRSFQKNPALVWEWADELQVGVKVASQIGWAFVGRPKRTKVPVLNMP